MHVSRIANCKNIIVAKDKAKNDSQLGRTNVVDKSEAQAVGTRKVCFYFQKSICIFNELKIHKPNIYILSSLFHSFTLTANSSTTSKETCSELDKPGDTWVRKGDGFV